MPLVEKNKMRKKPGPSLSKLPQPSEPEPHPKPPVNLEDHCPMTFNNQQYDVRAEDLVKIKELGRGNYGFVETMLHPPSGTVLAVKRIRVTLNNEEQKRMLIELNASMQSGQCPQMVKFFGAMFKEGDVWLCMEVMDMSLDKFYRNCVDYNMQICEPVLGFIAYSVIEALHYMKKVLNLMHRDVKPSNILINKQGCVKLCDFGISGHMTDSVAKTINAGCKPYMAPERINPGNEAQQAYDIRSDVWSLGVTMIEVATGTHPYAKWKTPFEQLKQVVAEPPPKLPAGRFSPEFQNFVDVCLEKDFKKRPRFAELLCHPFVVKHRDQSSTTALFFDQLSTAIASDPQRLSLAPPTEQLTGAGVVKPAASTSASSSDVSVGGGSSSADSDKIRRPNFS